MYADSKCIHELVEDTKKTTYKAEFGANGETNKNGKLHLMIWLQECRSFCLWKD